MRNAAELVSLSALLFLAGCSSLGPGAVERDRFDYVNALSDSAKRQMLLNLLKVRYGEAPIFMDVTSVIGAYSLEGSVRGIGEYAIPGSYRSGDNIARLEASSSYADKPTITYLPLSGEKFARSLMAPIPLSGLLLLIQSGYPADLVLRLCVNTINGLDNSYGGPATAREGSEKFHASLNAVREAQAVGGAGFRIRKVKGKDEVVMYLRPSIPAAAEPIRKIRRVLSLKPALREFTVVPGAFADNDAEIAIQARSMLQVIIDVASYADVPEDDIAESRVYRLQRTAAQERMFPRLIAIRHSPTRPAEHHVAIRYRNHWFWIDDRDVTSKQMLAVLTLLFSLTESASTQSAPVATIPAR